jgi:DNA helicase-2/ATP-dependent DNA helicase PcrA
MGNEFHILGPPGTGKTTYLTKQIQSARAKHGDGGVLVVSFTKAAAAEIGGRVDGADSGATRRRTYRGGGYTYNPDEPGYSGDSAPQGATEKRVGTLHSILYHQLGRPEIADTKAAKWNEDVDPAYHISGSSNSKGLDEPEWGQAGKHAGDKLFASIQKLRARMIDEQFWPMAERAFWKKWRAWKVKNDLVDFTDLIARGVEEDIAPPPGVRVGIVDEAQDFTKLELTLIRKWTQFFETTVLAYDDDQALYEFKGAVADTLVESLPPKEMRRVLSQSYRVPRAVHALADDWIQQITNRAPKEYKPRDFEGEVVPCYANSRHPEPMFEDLEQSISAGKSVMILGACSYMLQRSITELRRRGIPFHNPYRVTRGDWNPLRKTTTSVSARLGAFLQRNPRFRDSEGEAMLHLWTAKEAWLFAEHLEADVFAFRGAKKQLSELAKLKEDEPQFIDDAEYFKEDHLPWLATGDMGAFQTHLLGTKKKPYSFALTIAQQNPKLLLETPRVVVGTVHSVKGGEADVVYVFPDLSPEGGKQWRPAHGSKGRDNVRRLFYVAFTRARERLVLCQAANQLSVQWNT